MGAWARDRRSQSCGAAGYRLTGLAKTEIILADMVGLRRLRGLCGQQLVVGRGPMSSIVVSVIDTAQRSSLLRSVHSLRRSRNAAL